MAVKFSGVLPPGLSRFKTQRDIAWLWGFLQRDSNGLLDPEKSKTTADQAIEICNAMNRHSNPESLVEVIHQSYNNHVLPRRDIEWILGGEERLLEGLALRLFNEPPEKLLLDLLPPALSPGQRLTACIDLDCMSLTEKKSSLDFEATWWENTKSLDRQLSWIRRSNKVQCEWAWDYISKRGIGNAKLIKDPRKDLHTLILVRFDTWACTPDKRQLFLIQMKRVWSQKKYRDNNQTSSQSNFILSESAKKKLKTMAESRNKSLSSLVEELILKEYDDSHTV